MSSAPTLLSQLKSKPGNTGTRKTPNACDELSQDQRRVRTPKVKTRQVMKRSRFSTWLKAKGLDGQLASPS